MKFLVYLFTFCLINVVHAESISDSKNDSDIEIIEVKAQKRSQDIRDVPLSVNFFGGKQISELRIKDTTALSGLVPNFKITQNAAEGTPPAVNIRGVGSLDYNTSTQSPIGVYLDGAASVSANAQLINLFDVESIEVLRGPQGTLFGRNTTGGAILINSVDAKMENSGYVYFGYGQRNLISVEGAINRELSDSLAARLSFSHQDYDYSTNNLFPNAPQAGMTQNHYRFSLLYQADNLSINTKFYTGKWDGVVNPVGSIGVVKSFDSSTGLPDSFCSPSEAGSSACTDVFGFNDGSDNFHDVSVNNTINNNSPHTSSSRGLNLKAQYDFSKSTYLVSQSNLMMLERVHFYNSDGSPSRLAEGNQNIDSDTVSHELRLHHEIANIHWVTGLFYTKEELIQDNRIDLFRDLRSSSIAFSNAASFIYDNTINVTASALFSHIEVPIFENATLNAGLRYSKDRTNYVAMGRVNTARFVNDQDGTTLPAWNISGEINDSNLSGKLALQYEFNPHYSGFISFSRGFKSGGYNGGLAFSEAEAINNDFGAETLDAFEIGLHSQLSKAVKLYSAAFYYAYQDQQVFMNQAAVDPGLPPLQLLTNVGESKLFGAELDLSAQLTSSLSSRVSVGYLPKANLSSFIDQSGVEIRDNRLPFSSKWNISSYIDYSVKLAEGQLNFHLNADYQSKFFFDQNQSLFAQQKSYVLINTRVSWEHAEWNIGAWVKNITNEEYSHLKFDLINLLGMLQDFKAEARQVGLDVRYTF